MTDPWKGVSLGGWLLLEPGPSTPLFDKHPDPAIPEDGEARCEWELMEILVKTKGVQGARDVIQQHRESHISKRDFERIRALGLNAVRLPFGHWVVDGPRCGEPYVGNDGIRFIDQAVDWAEDVGLQIVLDLHGCPGGESGEAPCGHRQRPHGTWQWQQWDFEHTLKILETLALRYRSRSCVTGLTVCNEPSNMVPQTRLCEYYSEACAVIRRSGMTSDNVVVVLPLFQRNEDRFIKRWHQITQGTHKNISFDVHCYHCFENEFNGKTLAQHLRAVQANADMLRQYPMVVGEWSLALGVAAWVTCGSMAEEAIYKIFGCAQREAFKEASHGHFFWNWSERSDTLEWNYPLAVEHGMLSGPALELPSWSGKASEEDPLEERLHPAGGTPQIVYGEKICLRVFYGRYIEGFGEKVNAFWAEKGKWQSFQFCRVGKNQRRGVHGGDHVMLRAHNGRFLTVTSGKVAKLSKVPTAASRFVLHADCGGDPIRHRSIIYLESKTLGLMLDADEDEDGIFARYRDKGYWQAIAVEKLPAKPSRSPGTPTATAFDKLGQQEVATVLAKRGSEHCLSTPLAKRPKLCEISPGDSKLVSPDSLEKKPRPTRLSVGAAATSCEKKQCTQL